MSQFKYRITNIIHSGVVIEDLNIYLAHKGSFTIVDADVADRSDSLRHAQRLVKIEKFQAVSPAAPPLAPIPTVPVPVPSIPMPEPKAVDPSIGQELNLIKQMLSNLVSKIDNRPDDKPVASAQARSPVLESEMFIPSSILPGDAETHVEVEQNEATRDDLDDSLSLLRNLKRQKT